MVDVVDKYSEALSKSLPSQSEPCACNAYISAPTKKSSPPPPTRPFPPAPHTNSHHGKERYPLPPHPLSLIPPLPISSPNAHRPKLTSPPSLHSQIPHHSRPPHLHGPDRLLPNSPAAPRAQATLDAEIRSCRYVYASACYNACWVREGGQRREVTGG